MKKTVTLALTLALVLGLLSGCANNDTPADNAENDKAAETAENFTDEMKIPYAVNLSAEDGADSVERSGDHENSPYFAHPDVYNMESTDTLTVLMKDGTHHAQTGNAFPSNAEYAIKFIKKASGRIGGKEVAIEAKESSIASLRKQLDKTTDETKRQGLQEQITTLELGIQSIYQDDGGEEGLYTLMRKAVQLVLQRTEIEKSYLSSMDSQQEIEKRFAEAMGDMLIDGYWSNTAYAPGQEELLYYEALGVMERLAKPTVTYTVDVQNLSGVSGYEQERFSLDTALRIWDGALE